MVEPLEIQTLLARTQLVEKTVAAQREDNQQLNHQVVQMQKQSLHQDENVQLKRETGNIGSKQERPPKSKPRAKGSGAASGSAATVEWVEEEAGTPRHKLNVEI